VALYPGYPGHALAAERLRAMPNRLSTLLPDDARLAEVIRVLDFPDAGDGAGVLWLNANCVQQEVTCWVAGPAPRPAVSATLAPVK
jgi:hypothetical protein